MNHIKSTGFNEENLWGLDLGGTKVEGVILKSARQPEVIFRDRVPTEANKGYEHILEQVKKLVNMMERKAGYKPEKMGIGTPGVLIPKLRIMKNCNTTALNGKPLQDDLVRLLGLQLQIANDANCFALAEAQLGVVKEKFPKAKVIFGVIMGTGIGGGIVVNGQIINGFHGIGGEWGHNYLPEAEGDLCFCGKKGDNESILSGPALERYYQSLTGERLNLKEIASRTDVDPAALKTIKRLTDNFGLALSVVINILDPDVIVIGGGVGNIDDIYTEGVASVRKYVFNHSFEAPIVRPILGDSAGVFGAAYLVANH